MQGQFYFITDEFYTIHDKEHKLMRNKEVIENTEHGRPCFFAFADNKNPGIFWCVPISSKVKKYKDIYDQKIKRQREKGVENPKCNTICFGNVMGMPRAFLIQNMFPIIERYIASVYIDRNTKKPVTIEPEIEHRVIADARNVLRIVRRVIVFLCFLML